MNENKKRSKEIKIAGSGLRVLKLLKLLVTGPVNINDFLQTTEKNGDTIYRKEVVLKYINTLKLLGFKIEKYKDKYYLLNSPEKIDYSENELSLLNYIKEYAEGTNQDFLIENINDTLQKIERTFSADTRILIKDKFLNKQDKSKFSDKTNTKIAEFERYCQNGLKLKITYKNHPEDTPQILKIAPLKIIYKKRNSYLAVYDCENSEYKELLTDYIINTEQTPQRVSGEYPASVVFKLKGRLAKSYVLKFGEKVLEFDGETKIISNSKEDKTMLLHRLIRYYDKCEIIYPLEIKNKMIELIESIEKIYA